MNTVDVSQTLHSLVAHGAQSLSTEHLLALVWRAAPASRHAPRQARRALERFGSLSALLAAEPPLPAAAGAGAGASGSADLSRWAVLAAAQELVRRSLGETLQREPALTSPQQVRDFLAVWLRHRPYETFVGLFVDSRHHLISADELFRGTLTQTAVYPREVARRALKLNAAAVVLAHNHPSAIAEASQADRLLTSALKSALAQIDVSVLDHLIVAGNRCLSFAERGWL